MEKQIETTQFLQEFENGFIPSQPEKSTIQIDILGYGEISTVIAFRNPNYSELAFKRLPIFSSAQEAEEYCALYNEYNQFLAQNDIETPISEAFFVKGHSDKYVAFLSQQRLNAQAIGNKTLQTKTNEEIFILFQLILNKMINLWKNNSTNNSIKLGLDCQISNWAIKNYCETEKIDTKTPLLFIDTSTPFIRKAGIEQMNPLLFLQSAPKPMRFVLEKFFLKDVMDRYYDYRLVNIDLLANLFKEQRADLIPQCLELANSTGKDLLDKAIEFKEIESYYKEDKFIWQLFLGARRADRFIQTKLLKNRYEFTLPGKIKR